MFRLKNIVVKNVFKIDELEINKPVTCIVGESGSGKSTLLRLLNNLDDPYEGTIYLEGIPLQQMDALELRKQVPMSAQTPVVFDGTIRQNLLLGLTFTNQPYPEEETLLRMLQMLQLDKQLDTNAADLSGGEKQRLALGRILLMKNTKAILLDEPTSSLDTKTAWTVMHNITTYAKEQQVNIIMITHDDDLKNKLADDVIKMDKYRTV